MVIDSLQQGNVLVNDILLSRGLLETTGSNCFLLPVYSTQTQSKTIISANDSHSFIGMPRTLGMYDFQLDGARTFLLKYFK